MKFSFYLKKLFFGFFKIIAPHDKGISENIMKNLEPLESSWNIDIVTNHKLLIEPFDEVHESYFKSVQQLCYHRFALKCHVKLVFC